MEFLNSEKCNPPELKTYGLYRSNGTEAERTGKVTNGVHGIWTFDRLPYAAEILLVTDVMHTFGNVIEDFLDSMRPTQSGSGGLRSHVNRTYAENVKAECEAAQIHESLWTSASGPPPWIIPADQLLQGDRLMTRFSGCITSSERPLNVLKKGKFRNTHGLIYWATTYARYSLSRVSGSAAEYVEGMIELFEEEWLFSTNRIYFNIT